MGAASERIEAGDVLYEVIGPVALITLNRPAARNALTAEAIDRLARFSQAAAAADAVRAVVVTGAGEEAFCAGGDLGDLIPRLTTAPTSCSPTRPSASSATCSSRSWRPSTALASPAGSS